MYGIVCMCTHRFLLVFLSCWRRPRDNSSTTATAAPVTGASLAYYSLFIFIFLTVTVSDQSHAACQELSAAEAFFFFFCHDGIFADFEGVTVLGNKYIYTYI